MLFWCLWRNIETYCHKHFVVVSRHQQTPPLTTSDKCHNLLRSGGTVLITPSRSQRWQHAVKPDTGRESPFLPCDAMHKRGLCRHAMSVRPSVRLSRSWIVSKRINISSDFFHHQVAIHRSSYFGPNAMTIFRRELSNGSVECTWVG